MLVEGNALRVVIVGSALGSSLGSALGVLVEGSALRVVIVVSFSEVLVVGSALGVLVMESALRVVIAGSLLGVAVGMASALGGLAGVIESSLGINASEENVDGADLVKLPI